MQWLVDYAPANLDVEATPVAGALAEICMPACTPKLARLGKSSLRLLPFKQTLHYQMAMRPHGAMRILQHIQQRQYV